MDDKSVIRLIEMYGKAREDIGQLEKEVQTWRKVAHATQREAGKAQKGDGVPINAYPMAVAPKRFPVIVVDCINTRRQWCAHDCQNKTEFEIMCPPPGMCSNLHEIFWINPREPRWTS